MWKTTSVASGGACVASCGSSSTRLPRMRRGGSRRAIAIAARRRSSRSRSSGHTSASSQRTASSSLRSTGSRSMPARQTTSGAAWVRAPGRSGRAACRGRQPRRAQPAVPGSHSRSDRGASRARRQRRPQAARAAPATRPALAPVTRSARARSSGCAERAEPPLPGLGDRERKRETPRSRAGCRRGIGLHRGPDLAGASPAADAPRKASSSASAATPSQSPS